MRSEYKAKRQGEIDFNETNITHKRKLMFPRLAEKIFLGR